MKKLDGLQKILLGVIGLSVLLMAICFSAPTIFDLGGSDTSSALSWMVVVIAFCGGIFLASWKIDALQAWAAKAPKWKLLKLGSLAAAWFLFLAVFAGGTSVLFQIRTAAGHWPEMKELACAEGQLVLAPTPEMPEQAKRLTKQEAQELQSLLSNLGNGTQKFVTAVDTGALVISLEGSNLSFYPEYVGNPYGYFSFDNYAAFYTALAGLFAETS